MTDKDKAKVKVKDKVDEAVDLYIDDKLENTEQIDYQGLIDCLCQLSKKDFRNAIRIAKLGRRARTLLDSYFRSDNTNDDESN